MYLNKVYVGVNSEKVTDVLKNGGMSSGSPIEIAFWDGENREKRTLTYVRGDELGEDRRRKIEDNKPYFMKDKTQANLDVIKAIEEKDNKSLSNVRFVFSGKVLEGYIVISKEGNSIAAISAVAGATQWIETALIIAGIQELAGSVTPVYSIQLDNVLSEHPYQIMKLQQLIEGNPESEKMLQVNLSRGTADLYQAGIEKLIDGYYGSILEEVKNERRNSQIINKFSASPLRVVADSPLGGIDFTGRAMRLKIERVGSFADLRLVLPEARDAQVLDLDKEFRQIEAIASSGIVSNSRRILELFSARYSQGEFGRRLPQAIFCLKSSSAIQESLAIDSDDDFRMCLLLPEIFSDGR